MPLVTRTKQEHDSPKSMPGKPYSTVCHSGQWTAAVPLGAAGLSPMLGDDARHAGGPAGGARLDVEALSQRHLWNEKEDDGCYLPTPTLAPAFDRETTPCHACF